MAQTWPVVAALAATAALAIHLGLYLWRKGRGARSARYMSLLMFASAWWAFFNALEYLPAALGPRIVLANIEYLGIAAIPAFWYAFGLAFNGEERRGAGRRPRPVLWVLPGITAALVWLDPLLGLVRHSFRLEEQAGFLAVAKVYGPWFWVHSAYSYALILAGTFLIMRGLGPRRGMSRLQSYALAAGTLLPTAANFLYIAGLFPIRGVDPTPLAFSVTGLLLILNIGRFRFLSLVTAAREAATERLRDAIVVLDRGGRIAYANASARASFGLSDLDIGRPIAESGGHLAPLAGMAAGEERALEATEGPAAGRSFEVRAAGLDQGGRGLVMTLYDVTRRAVAEAALKDYSRCLEDNVAERTRALEETNGRLSSELEHRIRTERQLAHDALHDPLTGLANRSLVLSRIEQAMLRLRRDSAAAYGILYLDFDGFKVVNDTYGHDAGDAFLREAAARLRRCVREVDTVARLGGDEFVVLLEEPGGGAGLEEVAGRIAEELSVPVAFAHGSVVPSASIGMLEGAAGFESAADTLRYADIAMYRAKGAGRSQRVLFAQEMRVQAEERNRLTNELRLAIASGGIALAFQPIVGMDGAPSGWEVLARWTSAEQGPIGPDRFIPLAEEAGLIVPLGTFVLYETLKTAAALRDAGLLEIPPRAGPRGGPAGPWFSVNVAAEQLYQPDFAELVLSAVARSGLPLSILHLELTESAIIDNRDSVTSVLERLAAAGVSFKLDDFGTGYSSLAYLHRMPIDCVKIDRGFVSRMEEAAEGERSSTGIVRGIISLSHELGKTVVAEGVETESQARLLETFGCDQCQGWFYGRPVDRGALEDSLRAAQAPRSPGAAARPPG